MKTHALTKSMAIRNTRPAISINDPFRPRHRIQARFNQRSGLPDTMPASSQLRWPVLFAVVLCALALAFLNFAMQM